MSFVNLHVHDIYSVLDGVSSADVYASRAAELGQTHLATTNHGNINGVVQHKKACEKHNIKPIYGSELYIVPDLSVKEKGDKRGHVVVFAKNDKGWSNILKLVTIGNIEGFYSKPRIDYKSLLEHSEGLIVSTACTSSFLKLAGGKKLFDNLKNILKDDVYLEIMPSDFKDQKDLNRLVYQLGQSSNTKVIATNDCHYAYAKDNYTQEVLLAIQTKALWSDPNRWKFLITDLYLKSEREMQAAFRRQGVLISAQYNDAINNTLELAEKCTFELKKQKVQLPKIPGIEENSFEFLSRLCKGSFKEKILSKKELDHNLYRQRMRYELEILKNKSFEDYFLIVWELISWCKMNNVLVGPGRGCFLPGQKVITYDKERVNIESITKDREVINHLGEPGRVKKCFTYYTKEYIVNIQMKDGRTIRCTKDHEIFTNNGWIAAKNIKKDDKILDYEEKLQKNPKIPSEIQNDSMSNGPDFNIKKTLAQDSFNNTRSKINEFWIKSKSKIYLHDLQKRSYNSNKKVVKKKIFAVDSYRNLLYNENHNELIRVEKSKCSCSINSSEQTRCKKEKFRWSDEGSFKRPNFNSKKKCKLLENEYSRSYKNKNRKTSKQNDFRSKLLYEVFSKRIRIWENKWNSISIKLGANVYCLGIKEKYENTKSSISNTISRWKEKILSRFYIKQKYDYRNKRKSWKTKIHSYSRKINSSNELGIEKQHELSNIIQERSKDIRSIDSRLAILKQTKNIICKIKNCYEVVEKVWEEYYDGPVHDLEIEGTHSYNIEGLAVHNSVSGSLIAFLIGITNVDPIKHGLIFERFISPERNDYPDIDVDIEDVQRYRVREHLETLYGQNRIHNISTFLQIKSRMAIKDVGRVFEIDQQVVNNLSTILEDELQDWVVDSAEYYEYSKNHPGIIDLVKDLTGKIRGIGSHAAGIVISDGNIMENGRAALVNNKEISINWDKKDAEFFGMLKLDILGLSNLSIIHEALDLIRNIHNVEIDIDNIDYEDPKVLSEFAKGNCTGCFQFNTRGLTNLCKDLNIDSFQLLTHSVALFRPAVTQRGLLDVFIERRKTNETDFYNNEILNSILNETYGILLYQEQLMLIATKVANMSLADADILRKAFETEGSDKIDPLEKKFMDGAIANKVRKQEAIDIWELLKQQSGYGFNRAHATGYTMISVIDMWLKVYYPLEFMCACLSMSPPDKKQGLVNASIKMGIGIKPPTKGISDGKKWIVKDGKIYAPFIEIHGVGEKTAEKLTKNGFFTDKKIEMINTSKLSVDIPSWDNYPKLRSVVKDVSLYDSVNMNFNKSCLIHKRVKREVLLPSKSDCHDCELRKQCTHPVWFSTGTSRIVICGEAPSDKGNKKQLPFAGAGSEEVWRLVKEIGNFDRDFFHVTNVVKCYPGKIKRPSHDHIKVCSKYLRAELLSIQPHLIFAMGNTPLNFFTGKEKGIMDMTGTTTWSEEYGCWICWSINPGLIVRYEKYVDAMITAIENFVSKIQYFY